MTAGAPLSTIPFGPIARGGRLIGSLISTLRHGPETRREAVPQPNGRLDLAATAFMEGVTEEELVDRLVARRRETARFAYLAFGLGCAFVLAWLWRALSLEWTEQRLLAAAQFAPFCLIFYLTAFRQAHLNWQLRTGVLGSACDYLQTSASFWPRS